MWPELQKARDNAIRVEKEIESLLKWQNSLRRNEIENHRDTILDKFDESEQRIGEEIINLRRNLENHRKYMSAKAGFFERHYKIQKHK